MSQTDITSVLRTRSKEGYLAMIRLLALPQPPTAVFAADDNMAIGAMKAAAEQGIAVPGDVSIVGFDDVKIAGYLHPALTTVHQPYEEIASPGRRAAARDHPR